MSARKRAAGWNWSLPTDGTPTSKKRSLKVPVLVMGVLALVLVSAAGMSWPVVAQTSQTPQRQVEVVPPQQIPPVLDENGLLIVDQFATGAKPDEPYRAPAARPPIPGPAATYDVVLYNSRLILLETPSGGSWSRGVTYKRV